MPHYKSSIHGGEPRPIGALVQIIAVVALIAGLVAWLV